MNILLLGAGAVGEAYATLLKQRDPEAKWASKIVIADFSLKRAQAVAAKLGDNARFPAMRLDASNTPEVAAAARAQKIDMIMNGCPQHFNEAIFEAAYSAECTYMDMAYTLSKAHPEKPFELPGVLLGDYQFSHAKQWEDRGLLAFLGAGADPGTSQVFAKYAEKHLFDEIDEIGIRDGGDFKVEGHKYVTQFSVWSVIEECLNPPAFWSKDRGYYTSEPFSEPEIFDFPEIGPLEIINVEHEEVIAIPRAIGKGLKKVNFKICLGEDLIQGLKTLHDMGLTSADPIEVKGVKVSPRDVVEACLPHPADLGPHMQGKICVGTLVKGRKDGKPRECYIYYVADNAECMARMGCQAVAAQTALGPAATTELLAKGVWKGKGVLTPEYFDPDPYMEIMAGYGFPWAMRDSFDK